MLNADGWIKYYPTNVSLIWVIISIINKIAKCFISYMLNYVYEPKIYIKKNPLDEMNLICQRQKT